MGKVKAKSKKSTFDLMMAWEGGEITEDETTDLFQRLIDNGQAWTLQGMYGRQAQALIDAGYCHYPKKHREHSSSDYYGNPIPTHAQAKKLKMYKNLNVKKETRGWD